MILAVRINVPLIDVLAGMPNYGKFLKELVSNKNKLEPILSAFLSDDISAMIQNKVPPKLGDPGIFLIPCTFSKAFSCNALADLGARINLMPYSLYAKLSLETLKPSKMSIRLADRSFQHLIGIAENMLVEVRKFTFFVDFVILEMEEDIKVPLILGRPFLHTANGAYSFIDVIDEILEEDFDALLDEGSEILQSIEGTILEEKLFAEFDEFMAMTADENTKSESNEEEPKFEKITFNTDYKIKTSLKEPPLDLILKPLPDNLEYVFLEEPSFLPVIISSQLSEQNISKLVSVLERHKQAFAWKTIDISGIYPSFLIIVTIKPVPVSQAENPPYPLEAYIAQAVSGQRIDEKFKPIYYASKTLNDAQAHYTTTEKELLAVFFSFDKFRPYLILSKTVVYTDRSALKYLFSKQDAKPRLIIWVLLLQGFNIKIKDKKGAENLAADHLSRLENLNMGELAEEEIADKFPDEHLMILKAKLNDEEPWYADYVNYIVRKVVPPKWTPKRIKWFFSQVRNYFWDEPYAFRLCPYNVMRRCVARDEILEILAHCHCGLTRGHHTASITRRNVYKAGFYWPSIFKDAKDYVMKCDACQKLGNISSRSEMP
ncbi:reverse transcriptase domain-containing protein [Tanacetum coccineum]